jgi:hypothetical protein
MAIRLIILLIIAYAIQILAHDPFDYIIEREITFAMLDPDEIRESDLPFVFPVGIERITVDLSLDDGTNWTHNIAYGIWPEPGTNTITWHMRITPAVWTETARIGIRTLWEAASSDEPELLGGIVGRRFSIGGIRITSPVDGAAVAVPTYLPVTYQEAGADYVDIGISTNGVEFAHIQTVPSPGAGVHTYELALAHDVPHGQLWIAVGATGLSDLYDVIQVTITEWD